GLRRVAVPEKIFRQTRFDPRPHIGQRHSPGVIRTRQQPCNAILDNISEFFRQNAHPRNARSLTFIRKNRELASEFRYRKRPVNGRIVLLWISRFLFLISSFPLPDRTTFPVKYLRLMRWKIIGAKK